MSKIRVHELAKELAMTSDELLAVLRKEGVEVSSHLSALEADIAELIRDQITEQRKPAAVAPVVAAAAALVEDDELVGVKGVRKGKVVPKKPVARKHGEGEGRVEPAPVVAPPVPPPAPAAKPAPKPTSKSAPAAAPVAAAAPAPEPAAGPRELHLKPPFIVKELAETMGLRPNALIQELIGSGTFATINEALDAKVVEQLCAKHGFTLVTDKRTKPPAGPRTREDGVAPEDVAYGETATEARAPVVAFLGHVDHGKTSLLDAIRRSQVAAGEAGGITQHIGASQVEWKGHMITFLDTPGHEAFTAMRARGANATDIVVLIVAADDGFMPQTVEALSHARAANVPIIVAMNKIDLPAANPDRVLLQMQQNSLTPEEWGGDVGVVRVSAVTGEGVDQLLERIVLEAEILELKANPKLPVRGIVIESQLEQGQGNIVNVLVKNGTISVGDVVICGPHYGKVKALIDSQGRRLKSAGPSMAVRVVGLSGLPESGLVMAGCEDERQARKLAEERAQRGREQSLQSTRHANLEDLFRQIEEEARKDLKVVVKADVQGTAEAVVESLLKLNTEKIKVDVIHAGVGAITENDILLAAASDAIVIGFHVRVNPGVNRLAQSEGVEIRLYSIIYELIDQVREAMEGMLAPEKREVAVGNAEILKIFDLSRGKICGCKVTKGVVKVGAHARVLRAKELIYNGMVQSLRRFTDDVKEVATGFECGIRMDNFADFEPGDIIEVYEIREEKAKL